ncbi:LPXTG cell wall anchor domain-containing protein [Corynebacterium diphtheriae]|nr:LPXTG cell wall anchor domain-containing protein [Corynebacterium diphtheriae]CAB0717789.1 LPXTG cell wall anchor domain-containing protein [Corynebacterium diphtheriae]
MRIKYAINRISAVLTALIMLIAYLAQGVAFAEESTLDSPELELTDSNSGAEVPMTALVAEDTDGAPIMSVSPDTELLSLAQSKTVNDTPIPSSFIGDADRGLQIKVAVDNSRPVIEQNVTFTYTLTNTTNLDFWWKDPSHNNASAVLTDSLCTNLNYVPNTFKSSAKEVGILRGQSASITCTTSFDSLGEKSNGITVQAGTLWDRDFKKHDFGQAGGVMPSIVTVVSTSGTSNATKPGTLSLSNLPEGTNTNFDVLIANSPTSSPTNTVGPVKSNDTPASWTLEKIADKDYVKAGGEEVTYTYKVKNNTDGKLRFRAMEDDSCSPINVKFGVEQAADGDFIMPKTTTTWECKAFVDSPTTGIVQAAFQNNKDIVSFAGTSTFVGVNYPSAAQGNGYGISTCEVIDFTTVGNLTKKEPAGSLGSMYPGMKPIVSNMFPSAGAASNPLDPSRLARATTASATSSQHPDWVYFNPFVTGTKPIFGDKATGIYRINKSTGAYEQVIAAREDSQGNYHDIATNTHRLAFDNEGTLWSLALNGHLYSLKLNRDGLLDPTTDWEDHGEFLIEGTVYPAINGKKSGDMILGDIAFDGTGTMWTLGSISGIKYENEYGKTTKEPPVDSYLLSLDTKAFINGQSRRVNGASKIYKKGAHEEKKGFYGLAFGQDGTMYASYDYDGGEKNSNDLSKSKSRDGSMYKLDLKTGEATHLFDSPYLTGVQDLSSCAFPRPRLTAEKTAVKKTEGADDQITYTINIANRGTLALSGVTFQDVLDPKLYKLVSATEDDVTIPIDPKKPYQEPTLLHAYPNVSNPNRTRNPGVLLPGDTTKIELTVKVLKKETVAAGSRVCNQASVTVADLQVKTDDPYQAGGSDPTCLIWGKLRLQKAEYNPTNPEKPTVLEGLGGAEFAIYPAADLKSIDYKNPVRHFIAESDFITSTKPVDIKPGNYALVETKSPQGLNLLPQPILFKVEYDKDDGFKVTSDSAGSGYLTLSREKTTDNTSVMVLTVADTRTGTLPKTGGNGVGLPLVAGLALIAVGFFSMRRRV